MKSLNHHLEVTQAQTRILLALWDLGGKKQEVKRTEVVERAKRSSEKSGDYKGILQELEKAEVIKIGKKNKAETVFLTNKGLQMLDEGLKNPVFKYESNIGAKTANALLKWIREMDNTGANVPVNGVKSEVKSYEEFEKIALDVYEKLNNDYSYNHLVPIYRIRREIGELVSRSDFREWLLEMQANDILQLQGGSVEDSAPDKIEDSITTELDGLRCYARLLKV
ncbi:hypothetical protein BLD44_022865 [Mastigocladus laminosus UU774]|nr:hypothetical protein BLD44_022865 [Mastigocladus laminosus UU774]